MIMCNVYKKDCSRKCPHYGKHEKCITCETGEYKGIGIETRCISYKEKRYIAAKVEYRLTGKYVIMK